MQIKHIAKATICVLVVFFTSTLVDVGDWHLGHMMCVGVDKRSSLSKKNYILKIEEVNSTITHNKPYQPSLFNFVLSYFELFEIFLFLFYGNLTKIVKN